MNAQTSKHPHEIAQDACSILWAVCEDSDLRESVLSDLHDLRDSGADVATSAKAFIDYLHQWSNNESFKTNYETWLGDYI